MDYVRYRDGAICPYEHKRSRSRGDEARDSDRLQLVAYGVLLSEHLQRPVPEGRIRYHANNKTVRVPIDEAALAELRRALERTRERAVRHHRGPRSARGGPLIRGTER